MSMSQPTSSKIVVPKEGFDEETLAKIKELVSPEEYIRIANISKENKKKLQSYWCDLLGFPKEYVEALTEKEHLTTEM